MAQNNKVIKLINYIKINICVKLIYNFRIYKFINSNIIKRQKQTKGRNQKVTISQI